MFEDVCLACSRPVDASRAYCSDICARQDALSPDSSVASSASSRPSPVLKHTHLADIPPFVLHHPHPHYVLPLASPLQQAHNQRQHTRKRSSLSSSSASSALSTPSITGSAPPGLTDDDDSMSDPEFMLDHQLPGQRHVREHDSQSLRPGPSSKLPSLTYARHPSATNTRSTVSSALLTPDSAHPQTSSSLEQQQEQDNSERRRMRRRHAHHLSVPLVPLVRSTSDDDDDRLFGDDEHAMVDDDGHPLGKRRPRPKSLGLGALNPTHDRDGSYATLTAATAAEAIAASADNQNVTVKSKRHSARSRPRGSLPAYFSLLKMNTSPPQSPTAKIGSSFGVNPFYSSTSRASSPGSAGTATGHSTSRTRSRTRAHTRASHMRATPAVPDVSTLHGVGSLSKSSYTASMSMSLQQRGRKTTLTQRSVPNPEPDEDTPVPAQAQAAKPFENPPMMVADATQGTPRGRTRSRSQRPTHLRSRSRSRSHRRRQLPDSPPVPRTDSRDFDRTLDSLRRAEHHSTLDIIAHANAIATRGRRGRGVRRGSRSGSRDRTKRLVSTEPELRGARFGGYGFVGNGVGYGYAADFWDGAAAGEEPVSRGRERGRTESRGRRRSRERDRSWIRQRDVDREDMMLEQHLSQMEQQNEHDAAVHQLQHQHGHSHIHVEPVIFESVEGGGESDAHAHAPVAAEEFQRGRRRAVGVPSRAQNEF